MALPQLYPRHHLNPGDHAKKAYPLQDGLVPDGWPDEIIRIIYPFYESLRAVAVKTEKKILKAVNIFDVYEGDKIGEGKKSYALSFTFQDDSKTLTDKEVDDVIESLKRAYISEFGAEIR